MNSIKDISKTNLISLYQKDDLFLSNRAEKITTALYLVTDFIKDTNPLKFKVREKGLELMSFIMSFRISKRKENIFALILEIKSLLKLSYLSKDISEMNYSILIREYENILSFLDRDNFDKKIISLKDFFEEENRVSDDKKITEENFEILKDIKNSKGHLKDTQKSIKDIKKKSKGHLVKKQNIKIMKNSRIKSDRKKQILKFIKDNKEVSIKDIAKVIKGCSVKTIQRDLNELVRFGDLKKEGEKRWSKYLLG